MVWIYSSYCYPSKYAADQYDLSFSKILHHEEVLGLK